MPMKSRLFAMAGALMLLMLLGRFFAKPLLAQVRAALVQSVDEPGRNPYQETKSVECVTGLSFCEFDFSPVPAGKRLVVTNLSGYSAKKSEPSPLGLLIVYDNVKNKEILDVFFAGVKTLQSNGFTFFAHNQEIRAYYEPNEAPHIRVVAGDDSFASIKFSISGYYVNLP